MRNSDRNKAGTIGAALLLVLGLPQAALAGEHWHNEGHGGGGAPRGAPAPRAAPPWNGGGGGAPRWNGGGSSPQWGSSAPQRQPIYRPAPPAQAWNAPRGAAPQSGYSGGWNGARGNGGGQWNDARRASPPVAGYAGGYGATPRPEPRGQDDHARYGGDRGWAARSYGEQGHGYADRGRGYADGGRGWNGHDDRRDGWRGDRGWGYGERRGWDSDWRRDRRYDWAGWRSYHRDVFHLGWYSPPYGGYAYARLGIGAVLEAEWFGEQYWIDADYYHLPPAWGPYRWVRYYNDCLLIDINTGQVVDVVAGVFW